jgi:hypothetical protein
MFLFLLLLFCHLTVRDPDTQVSRGFAFINFDTFEAADMGTLSSLFLFVLFFLSGKLVRSSSIVVFIFLSLLFAPCFFTFSFFFLLFLLLFYFFFCYFSFFAISFLSFFLLLLLFRSHSVAIEQMNQQYIQNRPVSVTYALKKDSKTERHGSMAERILAANNPYKSREGYVARAC